MGAALDEPMMGPIPGDGAERARLVRLCAYLSGDPDAAEDLAQETLLEAWRNEHKLHDPAGRWAWLSAIARNVCKRRARGRGRELARRAAPAGGGPSAALQDAVADAVDLEVELERDELAGLLDRAMGLLPPDTRAVLVERLVRETPQAETAARLGLTEGTVAVRLHRGKLALRRVLSTELLEEAESFGLAVETGALRETPLWCPICGARRLLGRFSSRTGELLTRCPDCTPAPATAISNVGSSSYLCGVRGYGSALDKLMEEAGSYYAANLAEGSAPCFICGRPTPMRIAPNLSGLLPHLRYHIYSACNACGARSESLLMSLTLTLPEGQRFYRKHQRLRALPERDVEAGGRPAVVSSVEDVMGGARFDVVLSLDPYEVVGIHEH